MMVIRWNDIVGHGDTVRILKNMLAASKTPHAMLFSGPAGIGKMLVARAMAAGLLCGGSLARPCGECPSCRLLAQGTHPDLVVLGDDGASLKIDQIRALQHEASLAPYHGGGRVMVIEGAQRLTTQAANSLLKILEEPPAGTVFILTTGSPHALLPTIVSRCRNFSFRPLAVAELISLLRNRGEAEGRAVMAASLSGGRVGEALAVLAEDGLALRDRAVELVAALPAGGASMVWDESQALDKLSDADRGMLLHRLNQVLRDLMVIANGQDSLAMNRDIAGRLREMAAAWDDARLDKALEIVREAGRAMEGNANTRLTCEAMLINLVDVAREGT